MLIPSQLELDSSIGCENKSFCPVAGDWAFVFPAQMMFGQVVKVHPPKPKSDTERGGNPLRESRGVSLRCCVFEFCFKGVLIVLKGGKHKSAELAP